MEMNELIVELEAVRAGLSESVRKMGEELKRLRLAWDKTHVYSLMEAYEKLKECSEANPHYAVVLLISAGRFRIHGREPGTYLDEKHGKFLLSGRLKAI